MADSLTVHRNKTSVDVNKGGGVGGNKRGHLAVGSEACWVIKGRVDEGALCGYISLTTPHIVCRTQSHCCMRVRDCRIVGMQGGGVLIRLTWENVFFITYKDVNTNCTGENKNVHLSSRANIYFLIIT